MLDLNLNHIPISVSLQAFVSTTKKALPLKSNQDEPWAIQEQLLLRTVWEGRAIWSSFEISPVVLHPDKGSSSSSIWSCHNHQFDPTTILCSLCFRATGCQVGSVPGLCQCAHDSSSIRVGIDVGLHMLL